jgi:NADPH2:quinone reductase
VRGIVNMPGGPGRVQVQAELPEPKPAPDEVVVAVEAFSLNRGELALLAARPAGWRPGQEIAGTVVVPAADGGPPAGARVAAVVEQAG